MGTYLYGRPTRYNHFQIFDSRIKVVLKKSQYILGACIEIEGQYKEKVKVLEEFNEVEKGPRSSDEVLERRN